MDLLNDNFRQTLFENIHLHLLLPHLECLIAHTFGFKVIEALGLMVNRTDGVIAYLTAGSKRTVVYKWTAKDLHIQFPLQTRAAQWCSGWGIGLVAERS